jgi:hypothetical protein
MSLAAGWAIALLSIKGHQRRTLMLRRKPTRIELKAEDVHELDQLQQHQQAAAAATNTSVTAR